MQAWLDTTPEKSKETRRKGWVGGEPEAGSLEHVAGWLFEAGPISPQGLPIGWPEVAAWMQATGTDATPWEQNALIDLSRLYAYQASQSRDPASPAPWADAQQVNHAALAARRRRRHGK